MTKIKAKGRPVRRPKAKPEAGNATSAGRRIRKLAALSEAEYGRRRIAAAKKLGVRPQELDKTVGEARRAAEEEQGGGTQLEKLMGIAGEARLWRDPTGRAFATIKVDGRTEIYGLGSAAFRGWLIRRFGDCYPVPVRGGATRPGVPGPQAVGEALHTLAAYAERGPVLASFVRVGWTDDAVYLDLGTPDRSAVKVTAEGWSIVVRPRAMFLRPPGLLPLPEPVGGSGARGIRELMRLLGLKREASMLVVGWLLGCLMPGGPYPVLALSGVQGSGKTTITRILRRLVDPNAAETRAAPSGTC